MDLLKNSESKYDLICVLLEDNLIFPKSGDKIPRNIADFMPDYNLWYALKFANPGRLEILENKDLTSGIWDIFKLSTYHTRINFISIWLEEMIKIKTSSIYSIKGNWKTYWEGDEDLIDYEKRKYYWAKKILFIDRNSEENKEYISEKKGIDYITSKEFINIYNKNQRKYEKK